MTPAPARSRTSFGSNTVWARVTSLLAAAVLLLGSGGASAACGSGQGCSMGARVTQEAAASDAHSCCAPESIRAETSCCGTEASGAPGGCAGSMSSDQQPAAAVLGTAGAGDPPAATQISVIHVERFGLGAAGLRGTDELAPARIARAPLYLIDAALLI